MVAITAKKIGSRWVVQNAIPTGFSDVLELCRLAGVTYEHNDISKKHRTKRGAMAAARAVAELASARTGGAFEVI